MDIEKIDYIFNYFEKQSTDYIYVDGFYIIVHAMLHCLEEEDVRIAYFSYGQQHRQFKATLESFIEKRAKEKPKVAYVNTAVKLLDTLKNEKEFKKRLPIRTFLSKIIEHMPDEVALIYFEYLISNNSLSDRNKAYDVVSQIWSEEIKVRLINLYKKFYDDKCLGTLIRLLDSKELLDIVRSEELWEEDVLSKRFKRDIVRRIYNENLEDLDFIKEDANSYLYLLSLKRPSINDEDFVALIKQLPEENRISKIWHLGLMKKWNLLIDMIE